jgi:catechol 2,3-dioxygenase-like lactoylglutathione lyase family enzyme
MIDHVSVGTSRYADAVAFYQRALAPLGMSLQRDTGKEAAFGTESRWSFFLYPVEAGTTPTAPGMHLAFAAASRRAVFDSYDAAIAATARDLFTPRERPDISTSYFGAMFLDLDGHRVEVLTNSV